MKATVGWASASLEGVRVIFRRPVSFFVWTIVLFAPLSMPTIAVTFAGGFDLLKPSGELAFVASCVAVAASSAAVVACAIFRSMASPQARRFAYLRIGRDEARVAPVTFLVMAAWAGSAWVWRTIGLTLAITVETAIVLACLTVLAPVGPTAFFSGRFDPARSLRLGVQRFAGLLGMNLLALLLCLAFAVVYVLVVDLTVLLPNFIGEVRSVQLVRSTITLVGIVILASAVFVILTAPTARVVRALSPRSEDVADAFG